MHRLCVQDHGPRVKVEVNDRGNVYVAVKRKVWVEVDVLVDVHDPVRTASRRLFYSS